MKLSILLGSYIQIFKQKLTSIVLSFKYIAVCLLYPFNSDLNLLCRFVISLLKQRLINIILLYCEFYCDIRPPNAVNVMKFVMLGGHLVGTSRSKL